MESVHLSTSSPYFFPIDLLPLLSERHQRCNKTIARRSVKDTVMFVAITYPNIPRIPSFRTTRPRPAAGIQTSRRSITNWCRKADRSLRKYTCEWCSPDCWIATAHTQRGLEAAHQCSLQNPSQPRFVSLGVVWLHLPGDRPPGRMRDMNTGC